MIRRERSLRVAFASSRTRRLRAVEGDWGWLLGGASASQRSLGNFGLGHLLPLWSVRRRDFVGSPSAVVGGFFRRRPFALELVNQCNGVECVSTLVGTSRGPGSWFGITVQRTPRAPAAQGQLSFGTPPAPNQGSLRAALLRHLEKIRAALKNGGGSREVNGPSAVAPGGVDFDALGLEPELCFGCPGVGLVGKATSWHPDHAYELGLVVWGRTSEWHPVQACAPRGNVSEFGERDAKGRHLWCRRPEYQMHTGRRQLDVVGQCFT